MSRSPLRLRLPGVLAAARCSGQGHYVFSNDFLPVYFFKQMEYVSYECIDNATVAGSLADVSEVFHS